MAVLIRGIGKAAAVMQKRIDAAKQIRMHALRFAHVKPAVCNRNHHATSVVAQRLHVGRMPSGFAADNFRSCLIEKLHVRRRLDPQHGVGRGQLIQLGASNLSAPDVAESRRGLGGKLFDRTAGGCELLR